jgi:hypothetical protein
VGGNPYLIESSAAFEVQSTTEGLLYPQITTLQRDAIAAPATGLTILILLQFACSGIAALQMVVGMIPVEPGSHNH